MYNSIEKFAYVQGLMDMFKQIFLNKSNTAWNTRRQQCEKHLLECTEWEKESEESNPPVFPEITPKTYRKFVC